MFPIIAFGQHTPIPDSIFEQKLIDLGYDTTHDGQVLTANIVNIDSLNLDGTFMGPPGPLNNKIIDLSGIEDFLALVYLNCSDNLISFLDLNQNIALENLNCESNNILNLELNQVSNLYKLNCSYNQISYLDMSQNISLIELNCSNNQISYLDLAQNNLLTNLNCQNNQLSYLDVSQDTALTYLNCINNNLATLEITQNHNLTYLNCSNNQLLNLDLTNGNNTNITTFRCYNNPSLVCISVDDSLWADSSWNNSYTLGWQSSAIFSNNCPFYDVYTAIPDSMFEQKLIDLGYDSFHDGQVLTFNIRNIDSLDLSNAGITDLTGIEDFTHMSYLNCNMNELINFDISQNVLVENLQCRCSGLDNLNVKNNINLLVLDCSNDIFPGTMPCQSNIYNNNITNLNIGYNPLLNSLALKGNNISGLDLSNNNNLNDLNCQNNLLRALDVRNGNNINFTNFNALGNDSLFCIATDDSAWSILNWNNIPSHSFFSNYCSDYYTYIPDQGFEQQLIAKGYDYTIDGQVLTANIVNIDSLNLSINPFASSSLTFIYDLSGIEDFVNLTFLSCRGFSFWGFSFGELLNIDLSQNINLQHLDVGENKISNLDLSQNTSLTYLNCYNNDLSSLDLTQNILLNELDCSSDMSSSFPGQFPQINGNEISSLDLSQNTLLETLNCSGNKISSLDLTLNIFLETLNCSENELLDIDLSQNNLLTNLNCSSNQFSYLNISQNINLIDLNCNNNQLSFLDLQQNTLLTNLNCSSNQIAYLDVDQDTSLTNLNCNGNNLSSLDVNQNHNLTYLFCSNNNLLNLDLRNGNNTNFTFFRCRDNDSLNCISVDDSVWANTNWNNWYNIGSSVIFSNNCPFVDVYTAIPDSMFEQKLINLGYDSISDGQVLTSNIRFIDSLDVSNAGITDLTGIQDFTHISYLNINMNELTNFEISQNALLENLQCRCSGINALDLTQNPNLLVLNCNNDVFTGLMPCQNSNFNNVITNLNLSKNLLLTSLGMDGNDLLSLDVQQNSHLEDLNCQNNNLKALDLRNGNNINFSYFNALGNDSLYCIASDDSAWSILNWNNIPSHSFFSNYCSNYYTLIPDQVFEQNLIDKGYDFTIDGQVLTINITNIDSLSLNPIYGPGFGWWGWSPSVINDLTGIEDFINLTYLDCSGNQIDSLDFSQNPNLTYLNCSGLWFNGGNLLSLNISQNTALTHLNCNLNILPELDLTQNLNLTFLSCGQNLLDTLDLSQNILLDSLECNFNQLLNLDVSQNINLSSLLCRQNQLDTLDISQNSFLNNLDCRNNNLTALDLNQNSNLTELICRNNLISNIDISQNPSLISLNCRNNALTNLDLRNGNNTNFTSFDCRYNDSLYCISVDDSIWAISNWGLIPNYSFFSNNCNNIPDGFTSIPDSIFEDRLINLGYDNVHDGEVLTFNIANVDTLNINSGSTETVKAWHQYHYISGYDQNFFGIDGALFDANPSLFAYGNPITINASGTGFNYFIDFVTNANNSQTGNEHNNVRYVYIVDANSNPVFGWIDGWTLTLNDTYSINSDSSNKIQDLTGIQDFRSLNYLNCDYNLLTNLDLSQNTNLANIKCENNQLNCLNIKNGNNQNIDLIMSIDNPNLSCIEVDDSLFSSNNWINPNFTYFDPNIYFSNYCNNACSSCSIDLSINDSSATLTSLASNVSYQWLDCDDNYSIISGASNNFFNPLSNGNYAVELTQGNCIDTSACYSVANVGLYNNNMKELITHPNPTNENITISVINYNGNLTTQVFDLIGNKLQKTNETTISLRDYAKGIYILKVAYRDRVEEIKIIKQ